MTNTCAGTWVKFASACIVLGVALGCSVEQTEEGRAPDVDVDVDADPGRWPDYDVNWADVDIGTTERSITVPVVRVEKETRTVSVPYIDINPPGGGERDERRVAINLQVPHAGHELQITEVRASRDDLWVVGHLRETDAPATQAVTHVSDQVVIHAPDNLDVRTVIVGPQPAGNEAQEHRFVDSMEELDRIIPQGARILYRRDALPQAKIGQG